MRRVVRHFSLKVLSVTNINTLKPMIPELLQVQQYICKYRFSQDHLELLFRSIRASGWCFGFFLAVLCQCMKCLFTVTLMCTYNVCFLIIGGWNNNPSASQFQGIFWRPMVRCGVTPSGSSSVAAQDDTVSFLLWRCLQLKL